MSKFSIFMAWQCKRQNGLSGKAKKTVFPIPPLPLVYCFTVYCFVGPKKHGYFSWNFTIMSAVNMLFSHLASSMRFRFSISRCSAWICRYSKKAFLLQVFIWLFLFVKQNHVLYFFFKRLWVLYIRNII